MKRLLIASLLGSLSQISYGTPAFSLLQGKAVERAVANGTVEAPRGASCTNFAGKWKGKCTVAGQSVDLETEIKQDGCTILEEGGAVTAIGGVKSSSQSGLEFSGVKVGYSVAVATDWNADQTELDTRFAGLVKAGHTPIAIEGNGITRMDNGRLVEDLEMPNLHVSCAFDKE